MALVLHCSLGRVGIKYTVDPASQSSSQPAIQPDGRTVTAAGGEETMTGNAASAIQKYGYAPRAVPTQDSRNMGRAAETEFRDTLKQTGRNWAKRARQCNTRTDTTTADFRHGGGAAQHLRGHA